MSAPQLSDLGGLSAPLTKLLETCSEGIGQLAQPWQTKRTAKADAEAMRMISREMNEVKGDAEYKAHNFTITMRNNTSGVVATNQVMDHATMRQDNIADVVNRATEILETKENVSSDPVDKDWAVRFFSIVQDISNDELKTLWAKVLAGEVERPSSFSLRTLELLKNITSQEARIIQKHFQFCVKNANGEVFILGGIAFLKFVNMPESEICILQELNLLNEESFTDFENNNAREFLSANGNNVIHITKTEDETENGCPIKNVNARIPIAKLSTTGREIFSLIYIERTFDLAYLNSYLRVCHASIWLIEELNSNLTNL